MRPARRAPGPVIPQRVGGAGAGRAVRIGLIVSLAGLALACTPTSRDDFSRAAAKQAIRPVVQQRLPGIATEAATDCVIDNANSGELLALASDSLTGATASTTQTVTGVLTRPETIQCLATRGLPSLLR